MAEYRLCTTWRIEAPIEDVYLTIRDAGQWPCWWHGVERVLELEPGDASGVGRLQHYTWKGVLPYRLSFHLRVTRVEPQQILEGTASGELEGRGCWRFACEHPVTVVRHEWHVRTTRRWMNLLAPAARPLFEWNHAAVMQRGARGLARVLGARLLSEQRGCGEA
ncbi:MAG: SRPBCC family protein [Burkholderiaceae bacterium]|nr:SRPBCC family protein [Burkholderiaceae bacterium]